MKIVQISSFFHPSVGGVERQAEEIAAKLAEQGHEVEVLTTTATHGITTPESRLNEEYRGFKISRFKVWLKIGYFFNFAPSLFFRLWGSDADVIHVHNLHDAHLMPILLTKFLRKNAPYLVLTGHNPFVVDSQKRGGLLQTFVKIYDFFLKLLIKGIDKYIALLQSEANYVEKNFGLSAEKIQIIPNGIQDIFYTEEINSEIFLDKWGIDRDKWQMVVGATCRMNFVKGIQNLKQSVEDNPKILFIFAGGDGGYLDNLHKIYARNENVMFTDKYIPSTEVVHFYDEIYFFVLTSIYEPFGMTVVEAMARGKEVIATSAGGPSEILGSEDDNIIEPGDQAAWSKAIKSFKQQKLEQEESLFNEQNRIKAANYRWERIIKKLIKVYAEGQI